MVSIDQAVGGNILMVHSVADLRRFGSFKDVKGLVQSKVGKAYRVRARGWAALYGWLEHHRGTVLAEEPAADEYFVSPAARVIFALVELDGRCRLDQLGVTRANFGDKGIARRWRDDMARLI
ncbi:MAG: hypothetical protein AAF602_20890, partial [Myxococcota bacterium]